MLETTQDGMVITVRPLVALLTSILSKSVVYFLKRKTMAETYKTDPGELVKTLDTNAQHWAQSFMGMIETGHFSKEDIDEGLMISWFASAIETTKDSCRK